MTRKLPMTPPELTDAPRMVRLSKPFGLCQLFRPMPKDGADRPTLNATCEYGDLTLRFSAREALAAPEQTLLLVLLEIAYEQHLRRPREQMLDRTDRSEIGALLWSALHTGSLSPLVDAPATLRLSFSWSEVHRRCGSASTGGAVTEARRASLVRLCEVTVWESIASTKIVRSCRLVSWLVGDDQRVHVALNHRLASALLAPDYAQVLLSERLRLRSQTAMLVHAFLSSCLRRGKTIKIGHETLVERLWPADGGEVPQGTKRRRLNDVRAALRAIGMLDAWRVNMGTRVASVHRASSNSAARDGDSENGQEASRANSPVNQGVREMTKGSHFGIPSSSYAEQPFWRNPSQVKRSPRNDEPGTTL